VRGALLTLIAAGLALGCVLAATSGAAGTDDVRAEAAIADDGDEIYGSVTVRGRGSDSDQTGVDEAAITVRDGTSTARIGFDTAFAKATAEEIDVLAGRVLAGDARRVAELTGAGVEHRGGVHDLRIDGTDYGDVSKRRTIRSGDLRVIVNTGDAALRVVSEEDDDIRVAVASVEEPEPTPTPTPTATATATTSPSGAVTAPPSTYVPPSTPGIPTIERKPAPTVESRLTSGGYAFPVFGKARISDNFGASRPAPLDVHEGVDIFAKFGSPVVAVREGRISHVGTLPVSGNRLWLTTTNGDAFFYAHLSAFSDHARSGRKVKAGTVLGFVGNTGDAEPTPPHLHFEVHPGGIKEDAVDPYPIVKAWQRADDVPPGAWLQQLGPDATERPGALVTVRDYIAE
jgi:murein DD-endopeptidase MepM/ murein hydrolase activator NlpD